MNRCIFILILLATAHTVAAQLKADAGPDRFWCTGAGLNGGAALGGNPTADGGTPPYRYSWRTVHNSFYTAQQLLDSVTSDHPGPKLPLPSGADSTYFELQVTDSLGRIAYDTVLVKTSRWASVLADAIVYKAATDTVSLYYYEGKTQYGPIDFMYWSPGQYLVDSTQRFARCWAPAHQTYVVTMRDQVGCVGFSYCRVIVRPTGINEQSQPGSPVIFPNPVSAETRIYCSGPWIGSELRVLSADGKLVIDLMLNEEKVALSQLAKLSAGTYFYRVVSPIGDVRSGQLIVH